MNMRKHHQQGFTLIEVMVVVTILSLVSGALFLLLGSMQTSVTVQEAQVVTNDEARKGMLTVIRELRQAASASIAVNPNNISYRIIADLDGNGWGVDVNGNMELSAIRTLAMDAADVNGDGLTNQLILTDTGTNTTRVIANSLVPATGVAFTQVGLNSIGVTVTAQRATDNNNLLVASMTETVTPRN